MTDPVNLNRFRKQKARAAKKARADQNSALHGLPKSARSLAEATSKNDARKLDGKAGLTQSSEPVPFGSPASRSKKK